MPFYQKSSVKQAVSLFPRHTLANLDECNKIFHDTNIDADGTSNVVNGVKYWVACYYHCKRTFESFVWGNGNFRYPFTCYCKSGTLTINSKPVGDIISGYTKDDVCGSGMLFRQTWRTLFLITAGMPLYT